MKNAVIVGRGPAGISAALYTRRAGLATTVVAKDDGALGRAEIIENYYGFAEPVSGRELLDTGIRQAKRLGVELLEAEVLGVTYTDRLTVETTRGELRADFVVLATGAVRQRPELPGIAGLEGAGVSYCAVCDGFLFRQKPVAVLGSGEYAAHEAAVLCRTASSVTILTGGEPLTAAVPDGVRVDTRKLSAVEGTVSVERVRFADGSALEAAGVFVALGVAGSAELARKVGAFVSDGRIVTDASGATNVPGLYAAGDCTGGLMQIAAAVGDGAKVGAAIAAAARR